MAKEKKMTEVSKESELIPVETLHITDNKLKVKYVKEVYANKISNEEILDSDIWVLAGKENKKCYVVVMLQKEGETSMKITHMSLSPDAFEQNVVLGFYIAIETYYVNNNINCISITIPKIRGFTTKATKYFKKFGFSKYIVHNSQFPEGAVFLLKCEIEKWYVNENGEYKPKYC
jgi:hypothetical protein